LRRWLGTPAILAPRPDPPQWRQKRPSLAGTGPGPGARRRLP
jgi:hypothetical protein